MERIPMDGLQRTRKIIYEDAEAQRGDISLHYVGQYKLLCLVDRERNEISYFSDNHG